MHLATTSEEALDAVNPPATIAPFPTASGAIGCNVSVGDAGEHRGHGFVYAGAIALSVGAPDVALGRLLVEEPIDYSFALNALRRARPVEEHDFPVGGPFGVQRALAVYAEPEDPTRLNQGDILIDVPFVGQDARDRTHAIAMLGVVTANSCDCDKFFATREKGLSEDLEATWPIMVAPAHPPELLVGGQAGDAQKGRMPRYFPIPAEGDHAELVIDLWREEAIPAVILLELDRHACLSRDTRLALYSHLWWLRTRLRPEDVFKEEVAG